MTVFMVDGEASDRSKTEFVLRAMTAALKAFKGDRNLVPVRFGVSGYDRDSRALWQIPDVRRWCRELYSEVPSVFLLLHPATIEWFFLCVAEVELIEVEQKEPVGPLGEFYAQLTPEEKGIFKQTRPSLFLTGQVRLGPSADSLIQELYDQGTSMLERIASSQEEYDRLTSEFTGRLKQSGRFG